MATLIPAIGACKSRMTGGEKRLAERIDDKPSLQLFDFLAMKSWYH